MKGLLSKYYYVARTHRRLLFFLFFTYLLVFLIGRTWSFLFCFLCANLPIHVLIGNQIGSWEVYCGVLPCSKKQVVTARFVISLIVQGWIILSLMLTQALRLSFYDSLTWNNYISVLTFMLLLLTVLHAPRLLLETIRKKWAEVLQSVYYVIYFLVFFILRNEDIPQMPASSIVFFLPACITCYALCWYLSVKIYEKQEIV